MKLNKWTVALASAGVVSLASVALAEEAPMSQVLTAVSATTLSGYVDTSAIWKFGTGTDGPGTVDAIPGRAFDGTGKTDGFNLHVVGVTLEKPLGEDDWASGYRVDLLFGPDATGYNASVNADGTSDFGVKQAYVNLRLPAGNGLGIKMGVWDSIIGYEVFESYLNPNFGRSYGWQLEPLQNTGLLLNYDLSEAVSLKGGIANTWIWGINTRSPRAESQKAYMASISIKAPDSWGWMSGSSLSAGVVDGWSGNSKDTVNAYVGVSLMTPVEGLGVGAAFDYRFNGPNAVTVDGDNWAYALAGYLTYQATEKLKFAGRLDYTQGSDGTWIDAGAVGLSDQQNELLSATATLEYALWANVITRAEFRWDTCLTDDKPYGQSDENAMTLAANVIFKF